MIFLDADAGFSATAHPLDWDLRQSALVSGVEPWLRASKHLVQQVQDGEGDNLPLRDDLWLTVYPPRSGGLWRVVAEEVGPGVVGRGPAAEEAIADWRKRFQVTVQRFLEM